jgi:hypothetical protein
MSLKNTDRPHKESLNNTVDIIIGFCICILLPIYLMFTLMYWAFFSQGEPLIGVLISQWNFIISLKII